MKTPRWLFALLLFCFSAGSLPAETLFFIASLENGVVNYSWASLDNWYFSDGMGGYTNAFQLPLPTDTAIVLTDVNAASNQITLDTLIFDGYEIKVDGGNFVVGTAEIAATVVLADAYMEVSRQLTSSTCELDYDNITVQSGASWILSTNATTGLHSAAELTGTLIYNIGQIVLTDGANIVSLVGGNAPSSIVNRPDAVLSSSGMTLVEGPLTIDNGGTIRGDAGTIAFTSIVWTNSTTNLSQFKTSSSGATITINGLATVPASNTFAFSGPGLSVFVPGDAAVVEGTLQVGVVDSATGIIDPGTLECDADLTGTGVVHVIAGPGLVSTLNWGPTVISVSELNIDSNGVFNINSENDNSTLSGVTVNNSGTTTWTGGSDLEMDTGAVFNNLAGAIFDLQTNAEIISGAGTNMAINNAGTFRKSAGAGELVFIAPTAPFFNNTGLLDVQAGSVEFAGGMNSAQFNIASGAHIGFGTATYILAPGASFTGPGGVVLGDYDSPILLVNGNVAVGNFAFEGGTLDGMGVLTVNGALNWSAGNMQGSGSVSMASGSMLAITGGAMHRTINSAATTTIGATVTAGGGAAFNNLAGGVCALQPGLSISYDGMGAWPAFNNSGVLSNALGNPYTTIGIPFNNTGSVTIQSNRLVFSQGYTQTMGTTTVASGATMELNSAGALIAGGTLSGTGLVDGPLTNSATVHPGFSPGILNSSYYETAYTQTGAGGLAIDIGGLTPGAQFSQPAASGAISLNGALNLTLVNGFQPVLGDIFPIVTFTSETGAFASITGNHLPGGLVLVPIYSSTNVVLAVANDVNVTSPAPTGGGYGFEFNSTANFNYAVQFTDSLYPPIQWQRLTNVVGTGGLLEIFDASSVPTRFYRVGFH
jgi:hypothetical protein